MTPLPQPMTSRERLLATLRGQEPDRVPVVPDVSNMMPCRYTGKPYWEVYVNNNPPMWRAHIALQQRFGYDMILSGDLGASPDDPPAESRIISTDEEQWVVEKTIHTAQGNLSTITAYPRARSPWNIKPLITDPEAEIPALLATLTDPWRKSTSHATEVRQAVGDKGIIRVTVSVPLAWWLYARLHMDQSLLDFIDRQALVEKAMDAYAEWALELLKATFELAHPDIVLFSGSVSSMSVVSPRLYRRYAFPFLCRAVELAERYGVFTGVHMCGRSKAALPILAEAGIDLIEPLEARPGGDVVLADVKRQYGDRFCLKGNVNTFETLARGTPADVTAAARQCIEDAAAGGGFILSTGDQVSSDTPEENFVALIASAERYGRYRSASS